MENNAIDIQSWGDCRENVYEFLSFVVLNINKRIMKVFKNEFPMGDISNEYFTGSVEVHYNQIKDEMMIELLGDHEMIIKRRGNIGEFFSLYSDVLRGYRE